MKYEAKSVVFGRKPRGEGKEFKTAFFKIYGKVNPMSSEVMSDFPLEELDFENIEKVVMKNQDIEYYLEGNDIVFDNITSVNIEQDGTVLNVSVER